MRDMRIGMDDWNEADDFVKEDCKRAWLSFNDRTYHRSVPSLL